MCVGILVCNWLWVVGSGWGLEGVCRHQNGPIQVAVAVTRSAVTRSAVWTALIWSSSDASDKLVDSWKPLAVSRALALSAAAVTGTLYHI